MPRFYIDQPLHAGAQPALPPNAARHVQVLRLQPGATLTLFDGQGGEWVAELLSIGRRDVHARVLAHAAHERELARPVTLALGMPANDRMDWLVEKATELGAAAIVPLVCERSVLRVDGERAARKAAHWQAVAAAACEQCGRNRLPRIAAAQPLPGWLATAPDAGRRGLLLSLSPAAPLLGDWLRTAAVAGRRAADGRSCAGGQRGGDDSAGNEGGWAVLSGPEGGLTEAEQALAVAAGFQAIGLGPRVLRADTAPLAALALLAAWGG